MARSTSAYIAYPLRTARNVWRSQRSLVLVLVAVVLFVVLINPFAHGPSPHLPKDYLENQHKEEHSAPYVPAQAESKPPQDHSELRAFRQGTQGHEDEWDAIKLADEERRKEEVARKQQVAADRRKQEDEDRRKKEDEDKRKKDDEDKRKKEDEDKRKKDDEDKRKKEDEEKANKEVEDQRKKDDTTRQNTSGDQANKKEQSSKDGADAERAKTEEERNKAAVDPANPKDRERDKSPNPKVDASAASTSKKISITLDHEASGPHNLTNTDSHNITTTLVMGRLDSDATGVQWIHDTLDSITNKRIYIVDDPHAPLHLAKNKGREAMVYLQYIIDFYDTLDDVTLFFHSSRSAWHNNVLFNRDAAIMINNLRRSHVLDVGYMNARCELYPGCLGNTNETDGWIKFNPTKEEARQHSERNPDLFNLALWDTLFPDRDSDPTYLSEPCCSQFAVSRARIRSIPITQYRRIHDWLGTTDELDGYTGRIMEYVWQYLFLSKETHCPDMASCYCDGYGLCLLDDTELRDYNTARYEVDATLTRVIEENTRQGCDEMKSESKEKLACEGKNPYLVDLNRIRSRKGDLEAKLPKRYGITDP